MALPAPRIAAGFAPLLAPFELETLELSNETICGLFADLRIGYVNPAWLAYGRTNGGDVTHETAILGTNVLEVTPSALRIHYASLFAAAQRLGKPVDHDYDCPTPTMQQRFRMRVHPCPSGALVVANSMFYSSPVKDSSAASEVAYRDAHGFILQCCNCRRVCRHAMPGRWDFVANYVASIPPQTSHGICALCEEFFYNEANGWGP